MIFINSLKFYIYFVNFKDFIHLQVYEYPASFKQFGVELHDLTEG